MSETTPGMNLSGLLKTLKQQDANYLRTLLADELNNHIAILRVSGQARRLDHRDVGLILDRWSNVVTTMNLSESSAEAFKPGARPVQTAEQAGPEILRRVLNQA